MSEGELAARLGRLREASGRRIQEVCRPDVWSLGLRLSGGATAGFCWHPAYLAVDLCPWPWPRGAAEEPLKVHLKGARLLEPSLPVEGEPILVFPVEGSRVRRLVFEALGRSANLLLLDGEGEVLWAGRRLKGEFRTGAPGSRWSPPPPREGGGRAAAPQGEEALLQGLRERGRAAAERALQRRLQSLLRRREALREDLREGEAWEAAEGLARQLLARPDRHQRGRSEVLLMDFSVHPPREVPFSLDPSRSLLENAEAWFHKARKARRRRREAARFIQEIETSLRALEEERAALARQEDLLRLFPEGNRVSEKAPPQRRRTLPPDVAEVPLPRGFAAFAGKNAAGNDRVTFRLGKGRDFWFHAADYPGCHVVVRNPARLPALPPDVEREAACYAARHSGAPPGSRVEVRVAFCHQLRRVPGAPGRVMVAGGRTVLVDLGGGRC
ncbi:MAG: NFACT family protein [Acidobacteriota bacterium]